MEPLPGPNQTNSTKAQAVFSTPENSDFYSQFSFDELVPDIQEIRLIQLSTKPGHNLIHCKFQRRRISDVKGKYYALSYCAGNPANSRPVLLEGIPFNVFANLEHALSQILALWHATLPDGGANCLLWVDQICINQHNDRERSHQVGFMREIYSNSKEALICLSTDDTRQEATESGVDWMKNFRHACNSYLDMSIGRTRHGRDQALFSHLTIQNTLLSNLNSPSFVNGWLAFYDFCERPWWRRAWVQQEFICSPTAIFIYQGRWIRWEGLSRFLPNLCNVLQGFALGDYMFSVLRDLLRSNLEESHLSTILERGKAASSSLEAVELLVKVKESWRGDEDLKEMLSLSRHCRSSDPRDRVFAFLGLAHPGYGLTADYDASNTLDKVLLDTARRVINFEGDLGLLSYAVGTPKRDTDSLPSWVPDWTSDEFLHLGGFAHLPHDPNKPLSDTDRPFVHCGRLLRVRGMKVDSIQRNLSISSWANALHDCVYKTARGHVVRCRSISRQGDELWVLLGAKWPFILRPNPEGYILVSEAEEINIEKEPADKINFGKVMTGMLGGVADLRTITLL
ncbi:heterokaryon incompatibility protein-domain-containing protein [Apodospora peruviana]|uniref:Heterokaryon incompatibility protein-domain-containing protein n=1 Tax=Apodospora peruviana TaxID=516989 RepID=A0AAE0I105_9PEZI|nr:heterokaryon incompatibility protein-domain-containing protein [Apodospora peruviana]